ncbi:MAG: GntR family transcriptional regulator [Pseudomonadota bacterium]
MTFFAERISYDRVTAPQYVVRILREAIVTGAFSSGKALNQDRIARELNTSKIPVREALRELEGQGLVYFVPNRGFVVKETSYAEMIECFKLRQMLELFAVRESVPLSTPEHVARIEAIIDEFETVTDPMVSSHWNLKLHLALYAPTGMEHLQEMITRAHTVAHRYTHIYMRLTQDEAETQDEHRAILAAYRQKDVDLAVRLMEAHIGVACERFAAFLKDHLS